MTVSVVTLPLYILSPTQLRSLSTRLYDAVF
jgi:hypothetical protein